MQIFRVLIVLILSIQYGFSQKWEMLSSMPPDAKGRNHPVTFAINGLGYVGVGLDTSSYLTDFYSYNPTNDAWTKLGDFPDYGRGYAYGLNYEGKGYLGFGIDTSSGFKNDMWEYDPAIDQWTKKADCPCQARAHPAFLEIDGKIYVGLGSGSGGDLDDWWEYDIQNDSWTQKKSFPALRRHHPYYFGVNGLAYVGMGHHAQFIFNDLYEYDPITDEWKAMTSLPSQGRVAGQQFAYNGNGYVLSGQGETHNYLPDGEFWEFNPTLNTWEQLESHPGLGRWAPGSFVIGDSIYFTCGEDTSGNKADLMRYVFENKPNKVADVTDMKLLSIFPNPAQGQLNFNLTSSNLFPLQVQIINMNGVVVLDRLTTENNINIETLPPGVYDCVISRGKEVVQAKFVKGKM